MKLMKIVLMVCVLVLIAGCQQNEIKESSGNLQLEIPKTRADTTPKYCALTAFDEDDGRFLMVDKLFSNKIVCDDNKDCYNVLLEDEEYRELAPEFKPYLSCEESKDDSIIAPNQL